MSESRLILVVDDDADIRDSLRDVLEDQGFRVETAINGRMALEVLRKGLRPSVILLDLMMPVMDGWAFRQEQMVDPAISDIPVVLVTASGHCDDDAVRLSVNGCVRKPVSVKRLLDVVEETATR